jgi:hypothetical protein
MVTRTRSRCDAVRARRLDLPHRRAACRREAAVFVERLYVVVAEDDGFSIDVLDRDGEFVARFVMADRLAAAGAVVRDATGFAPKPQTVEAFAEELLGEGLAISSSEVCAWLLLRALA